MGRRGKVGFKRNTRRRVQMKYEGSDESDEDYKVGADEEFVESDEYCSLDGDASEQSLGEFDEEEEEEEEEEIKVKKVARSKARKSFPGRKANGIKKPRKRKRVSYKQDDDEDDDDCKDDDDEEFTPDDIDSADDEDEMLVLKKNRKVGSRRPRFPEKGFPKGRKRKMKSKVLKKPMRKRTRKNHRFTRKTSNGNDGEITDKNRVVEEKSKDIDGGRRRRLVTYSDSDFVSSGLSDYDYTISEEEREQVREAGKFCPSLRSSSSSKRSLEEAMCQQRKRPGRKGKEKVEDLRKEVGKQVCGICLSEEGKKTVRGTLNCCSHYFCFACIMEWSKVESRCPLCKQRFVTISKPARSSTGFYLRTVVIEVPECDQVYQPSEEELRGYIDPYESVLCTECQQGGDDALMLLCDLCDSPAHTYCVGLGREVPEGNWYCEGCRPTAFGSLNPHGLNPMPDQRANNNLSGVSTPIHNVGEGIDLNSMYVPDAPLTQETGDFSSSRRPVGDNRVASPASGNGAFTVSERRRIQRQIHHLLNDRMNHSSGRSNGISATHSGVRLFGFQLDRGREIASQQTITPERLPSHNAFSEGRLQDNTTPIMHSRDFLPARSNHVGGQVPNPISTSRDGRLQAELAGINMVSNPRMAYEQLHPCNSRSSMGSGASTSPYACREGSHFYEEKGRVQQMVRNHLKSLSRDVELGYNAFKDIARSSTHTVLAACGLEHRGDEVYPVQPPSICNHNERTAGREMSLMKGHCSSCFDLFVKDVVREIVNARVSPWIRD